MNNKLKYQFFKEHYETIKLKYLMKYCSTLYRELLYCYYFVNK